VKQIWSYIDESPDSLENAKDDEHRYTMDLLLRAGKIVRNSPVLTEAIEYILVQHNLGCMLRPIVMMLVSALRDELRKL